MIRLSTAAETDIELEGRRAQKKREAFRLPFPILTAVGEVS